MSIISWTIWCVLLPQHSILHDLFTWKNSRRLNNCGTHCKLSIFSTALLFHNMLVRPDLQNKSLKHITLYLNKVGCVSDFYFVNLVLQACYETAMQLRIYTTYAPLWICFAGDFSAVKEFWLYTLIWQSQVFLSNSFLFLCSCNTKKEKFLSVCDLIEEGCHMWCLGYEDKPFKHVYTSLLSFPPHSSNWVRHMIGVVCRFIRWLVALLYHWS